MKHPFSHSKTVVLFSWQNIRLPNQNLNVIHRSETKLEEKIDELMKTALETVEIIEID